MTDQAPPGVTPPATAASRITLEFIADLPVDDDDAEAVAENIKNFIRNELHHADPGFTASIARRSLRVSDIDISMPSPATSNQQASPATVKFDGGVIDNPGPGAIGIIIRGVDSTVKRHAPVGTVTNNQAEYYGLIYGLLEAEALGFTHVRAVGDSELVVKQMTGDYRVRDEDLQRLHRVAQAIVARFDSFEIEQVDRSRNAEADRLVEQAMIAHDLTAV